MILMPTMLYGYDGILAPREEYLDAPATGERFA